MASSLLVVPVPAAEIPLPCEFDPDELEGYEFLGGVVTEKPMANRIHEVIKNQIGTALVLHFGEVPGFVSLVETTFELAPRIVCQPDVAVVERTRWLAMDGRMATGAPEIAIEVISSDTADRLKFKTDAYLHYGSKAVCCIYPNQRLITMATPDRVYDLRGNDSLTFPDILPGFSLPLGEIFPAD